MWILPIVNLTNGRNVPANEEPQYDLLLDEGRSHMYIAATETSTSTLKCTTLAHGIHEGFCEHPYFAYPKCRSDINTLLAASATKKLVFSARPWIDDENGFTIGINADNLVS